MEPHRLALPPGYRIENYEIQAVLGKGGFGITYVAYDWTLNRHMAIKELLPDTIATRIEGSTVVAMSPSHAESWQWARERFVEEAQILAGFRHPNIIAVHRLIEANGTVYLVMDHLEGESYEARLRRIGREPDQDSLMAVIGPLLDGLQEVHAAGLLHRDIKPENILFDKRGNPVLIDFGSARATVGATMTMTSIVTHGYSPIEQYQTKGKMGPWTDIYAMAAVMCRAISGEKPPVAAERVEEDTYRKLSERNDLSGFSGDLLKAIDRGLETKSKDRPQTIPEWKVPDYAPKSGSLEPSIVPLPQTQPIAVVNQKLSERKLLWLCVGLALVCILLFGILSWQHSINRKLEADLSRAKQHIASVENEQKANRDAEAAMVAAKKAAQEDLAKKAGFVFLEGGALPGSSQLGGKKVASFQISRLETTWDEWQKVREWAVNNGYDLAAKGQGHAGDHPVVNVDWFDVMKWCNAKSEMEGVEPVYEVNESVYKTGQSHPKIRSVANGYRLPTEAEWEWAARGGNLSQNYAYSGGNNIQDVAWFEENARILKDSEIYYGTFPVGKKCGNELGIFDMTGNVSEYIWDEKGTGRWACALGGNFISNFDECKLTYRSDLWVRGTRGDFGFRLVKNAPKMD